MATQNLMGLNPANLSSVLPSPHSRSLLLGLPCASCKAYYAAVLEACPVCGCKERTALFSKRLSRKGKSL
jgi:hypothetical protein